MSVVVPPMSKTRASSSSGAKAKEPMTLAAGPERMVWAGASMEASNCMLPPSALRMRIGTASPFSLRERWTAEKNSR